MESAIAIPRHWSSTFLNNDNLVDIKLWFTEEKCFVTEFKPHAPVEGPKAHSHGGFLATILDETMGGTCWYNGMPVLAANLHVRYRRSLPLGETYRCTANIDRLETKRAMLNAKITRGDTVYAEATGVFVRIPLEFLEKQKDMARMVEIVQSIKEGRSIASLIELDKSRRRTLASPAQPNWNDLWRQGEKLIGDAWKLLTATGA